MSLGPGSIASFFPVGPVATNSSVDQTLIVAFASRFFFFSAALGRVSLKMQTCGACF